MKRNRNIKGHRLPHKNSKSITRCCSFPCPVEWNTQSLRLLINTSAEKKGQWSWVHCIFALAFVLIFGSLNVTVLSLSDYALHFPNKGTSDYVNIWGMPSLTQFTVCLWVRTNATTDGTPFSYAVPGEHNEIAILGVRATDIHIAG